MSKTKRKRYTAEFKAKIALEAIMGDQALIIQPEGALSCEYY